MGLGVGIKDNKRQILRTGLKHYALAVLSRVQNSLKREHRIPTRVKPRCDSYKLDAKIKESEREIIKNCLCETLVENTGE